ncbi:MAG: response regulator [Euryarchaeota archaeon]|nr:response regulator [Euryarchaeota archaeon]
MAIGMEPKPRASKTSSPARVPQDGRRIVLLVDDEADTLHSLKEFLESKLSVRVLMSGDAEAALRILRTTVPDLLIVDQLLPGMNGVALVKAARKVHPKLRAVLVTGHPNQAAALAEIGEDKLTHSFMKPLTTAPFVERLREILL